MKSGEFAALCQTTKETLRHYERVGVLKPSHTSDAGYKLYEPSQIVDYWLVSALQSAGLTLAQVQQHLNTLSNAKLEAILAQSVENLAAEREALLQKQAFLQNTLDRMRLRNSWLKTLEKADDAPGTLKLPSPDDPLPTRPVLAPEEMGGMLRFERCPEMHFIATDVSFSDELATSTNFESVWVNRVAEHMAFCRAQGLLTTMQVTWHIGNEEFLSGHPNRNLHICTPLPAKAKSARQHTRSAGVYLKWLRTVSAELDEADHNPWFSGFEKLRAFLAEKNLRITSDTYDTEFSLYAGDEKEAGYIELAAQVAPLEKSSATSKQQ